MKNIVRATVFLCLALLLAGTTEAGLEVHVIRSPFARASFSIIPWPQRAGEEDAIRFSAPIPMSDMLHVWFSGIANDSHPQTGGPMDVVTTWGNVEIKVDPDSKGTLVSYSRSGGSNQQVSRVELVVPSSNDKQVWENRAAYYYEVYAEAFFGEKRQQARRHEKREKEIAEAKALAEKLRREPILVYPEN